VSSPSGAHDQIFIIVSRLRSCFCGAPSLTRGRVSFVYAAGPRQRSLSRVRVPWISRPYFTLCFETSLFVASYDSQGHGGGIRPRLHTGPDVCLSLSHTATNGQSVCLSWCRAPSGDHDQILCVLFSLYNFGADRRENILSNSWTRCFPCGPCRMKGKWTISSSQNLLFS
jgi:hypothetical protein